MFPQLPAAVRVFLCTRPTDLRKSFDGLTGLVQVMGDNYISPRRQLGFPTDTG
jgi:hypothetical protein